MGGCCSSEEEKRTPLLLDYGDVSSSRYGPNDDVDATASGDRSSADLSAFIAHDSTKKGKKRHRKGSRRYALHKRAQAALESGIRREVVRVPEGEEKEAWLAVHVVDFYNDLNALTMIIEDCCTVASCPVMGAGDYTYLWADGVTVVEPMKVPAPLYIQFLINWCDQRLSDETLFPLEDGVPYPENFVSEIKLMMKRMFRVYAHMYHCHFADFAARGCAAHLNTCFKWFILFALEHRLVPKRELRPLQPIIEKLIEPKAPRTAKKEPESLPDAETEPRTKTKRSSVVRRDEDPQEHDTQDDEDAARNDGGGDGGSHANAEVN